MLLDAGAGIPTDDSMSTAPKEGAFSGNPKVIKMMLDAGTDPNARPGGKGISILQSASFGGSEEVVQLLLNAGAHVNPQEGEHGSA